MNRDPRFYERRLAQIKRMEQNLLREVEKKAKVQAMADKQKNRAMYRKRVMDVIRQQPIHELDNFELRGFGRYKLAMRVGYNMGFRHEIPAEVLGSMRNLFIVPWDSKIRMDHDLLHEMKCSVNK